MNPTPDYGDPLGAIILFDENIGLAVHLARRYARRYPLADINDLVQEALIALLSATRKHDPLTKVPFGAYAGKGILWAIWHHLRSHGFPSEELSLEETIGTSDDGDPRTRADQFDALWTKAAERQRIPNEREAVRRHELRELVRNLGTLTVNERAVLVMRYIDGLETAEIQARLHASYGSVTAYGMKGIKKLRSYFRGLGVRGVARGKLKSGPVTDGWKKAPRANS